MYNEKHGADRLRARLHRLQRDFMPQFIMGSRGMPRRYYDYLPQFTIFHQISTVGSWILATGLPRDARDVHPVALEREEGAAEPVGLGCARVADGTPAPSARELHARTPSSRAGRTITTSPPRPSSRRIDAAYTSPEPHTSRGPTGQPQRMTLTMSVAPPTVAEQRNGTRRITRTRRSSRTTSTRPPSSSTRRSSGCGRSSRRSSSSSAASSCAYGVYRSWYPEVFVQARHSSIETMGMTNTLVLLVQLAYRGARGPARRSSGRRTRRARSSSSRSRARSSSWS